MLSENAVMSAMAVERKMYGALSELQETTIELSDAFKRQDQVSFRLYLGLRQDSINQLVEYRSILRKQCLELPDSDKEHLEKILAGDAIAEQDSEKRLIDLAKRNKSTLERIIQQDRLINQRLGGKKSFYRTK